MIDTFETSNGFGTGVVKSWASIIDDNTREQAEKISRLSIINDPIVLMPDAHFGYGPPVGSAIITKGAVMPYAVGVDIGCGMIAMKTELNRSDLEGKENTLLGKIREVIPSGVGKQHDTESAGWASFVKEHGFAPGIDNISVMAAAMMKRHSHEEQVRDELMKKARLQFGTLGAGNHFVEVCTDKNNQIWLMLHSGSRGIGNVLASAHVKIAKETCYNVPLNGKVKYIEDKDFAYICDTEASFIAYIDDMLWSQAYAMSSRNEMMYNLKIAVTDALDCAFSSEQPINCHHNYAEEIAPRTWLTRKGAINAEKGRMGIIPGSMGAPTHIVVGKGCEEAYNTAPHGAGRMMSRGQARREGNLEAFKYQMKDKTWQDRDADKLLDEAPTAYKSIDQVMKDSNDLVETVAVLNQFINYKGI